LEASTTSHSSLTHTHKQKYPQTTHHTHAQTGTILDTDSQHYRVAHRGVSPEDLMAFDTLRIGVLILQLATLGTPKTPSTPVLDELISEEEKAINTPAEDPRKVELLNKLECLAQPLEKELRTILDAQDECPSALRELCVQSCDPVRGNRPDAIDQWDWLDSILDDAAKAEANEKNDMRKFLLVPKKGGYVAD
jgi:hypothetical protein